MRQEQGSGKTETECGGAWKYWSPSMQRSMSFINSWTSWALSNLNITFLLLPPFSLFRQLEIKAASLQGVAPMAGLALVAVMMWWLVVVSSFFPPSSTPATWHCFIRKCYPFYSIMYIYSINYFRHGLVGIYFILWIMIQYYHYWFPIDPALVTGGPSGFGVTTVFFLTFSQPFFFPPFLEGWVHPYLQHHTLFPDSGHGVSHFSKQTWSLLLENGFYK